MHTVHDLHGNDNIEIEEETRISDERLLQRKGERENIFILPSYFAEWSTDENKTIRMDVCSKNSHFFIFQIHILTKKYD